MKKYYLLIIVALILGLVLTGCSLLSNISQVPATDQSGITYLTKGPPPTLFSDDFNDGNADGWTAVGSGGTWTVEDDASFGSKVYSQSDTSWTTTSTYNTYWRSYGSGSWTNYMVEAKVKIVSGGALAPIAGIFFRVQGTDLDSGYYMFRIDARAGEGPGLIRSPNILVQKVVEPAVIGQIYTLKVIVEGNNIKCYIDDVKKFEVTDSTYSTGGVGVGTFNAHTHFDDVLVRAIRVGSITINSDDLYTNTTAATLNLSAYDAVGVTEYRVDNGTDASGGTTVIVPSTTSFSADIVWDLTAVDGTKTVAVQYRDAALNWSPNYTDSIILDQTPPVVTIPLPNTGLGIGVYLLNEVVSATWSATDDLSGVVPPTTGTIPIDTSSVGTGQTLTVPVGTAVDNAGNESLAVTATYSVQYGFSGLLSPYVVPPKAFKISSSIPLKWQYTDYAGIVVDSSAANPSSVDFRLVIATTTEGEPITVNDPGSSGLRYDALTMTWQFNWQTTKGLQPGIYNIRITSVQLGQTNGPFPIQLK